MDRQRALALGFLALLLTLLNAVKPLTIDDAAYQYFAHQSAIDPLHPYHFRILWYYTTDDAMDVLAPPVLPAWWGLGIRLLGDSPFLWKLWLAPFAVALVFALHDLFWRFCRGTELPLVVLTVFSPQVLPAFNLMLDVPALALGLSAIVLFLRALDGNSLTVAIAAALLAGVATETKYTTFLVPPVLAWAALLRRRWGFALVGAVVPALVFAGVEAGIALEEGRSHFLRQLELMMQPSEDSPSFWDEKLGLFGPLAGYLGGLAPGVFLLGVAALTRRSWAVAAAGGIVVAGLGVMAVMPVTIDPKTGEADFMAEATYFGTVFAGLLVVAIAAAVCLLRRHWRRWRLLRGDLLLLGWWLSEFLGYFPLTPFPAARRTLGMTVVLTLLVGRWAARRCHSPGGRRAVWLAAGVSAALGGLYAAVDAREAFVQKSGAEEAAQVARAASPGGRVWFVGHWGFQFYAERAGMIAVEPGVSVLHAGDTLVVPAAWRIHCQTLNLDAAPVEVVAKLAWSDPFPLTTMSTYYGGHKPIERIGWPRLELTIYRVRADFLTSP